MLHLLQKHRFLSSWAHILCAQKDFIMVYWEKHMQKPCLCLIKSFSKLGTELTLISGTLAFICWDSPHVKPLALYRDMLSLGEQAVMFDVISFSTAGKARGRLIKQANAQRAVVCKVFWWHDTGIFFPWCRKNREQVLCFRGTFWVHKFLSCVLVLSKYRNTTLSSFST